MWLGLYPPAESIISAIEYEVSVLKKSPFITERGAKYNEPPISGKYTNRTDFLQYFDEGNQLQGVEAEIEMPTLTAATNEISGPGIADVISVPTPSLFDSIEVGLTFRNLSDYYGILFKII